MTKTHYTSSTKTIYLPIIILMVISLLPLVSAIGSVPESEIPSSYTSEQSTALNEIFDKIWIELEIDQISAAEFTIINATIPSYTTEQKPILYLLMEDTWNLTVGYARMSAAEFIELKTKYHPDTITQDDPPQDEEPEDEEDDEQETTNNDEPTSQQTISSSSSMQEDDRIVLNSKNSNSNLYTKEGKTRLWMIYGFMIFAGIIIILLALRKL